MVTILLFLQCPQRLARALLLVALLVLGADPGMAQAQAQEFLDADQAFALQATPDAATSSSPQAIQLRWKIAEGYTLYKARLHVRVDGGQDGPGRELALELPAAERKPDPTTGESVEVYHRQLDLRVTPPAGARTLDIEYQGCADAGLCYPPQQRHARLDGAPGGLVLTADEPAPPPPPTAATPATDISSTQGLGSLLRGGNLVRIVTAFFVSGVLLSLTPCVLPMVPILSSILVGQQTATRRRGLQLALAYSLGMALVYTALGVAAGLAGEGLAAFLQQPPVLIGFALLLAVMSLSMFDVFTLQVPAALQTRLASASDRVGGGGGAVGGALAMGALSALMVGPCVAAPLAGALLYIGQSRDVVLGGLALFSLASGMSVPLLLTGVSAGSLVPRAGAWMGRVKHVFGLLLLAVAWWMVQPVLGGGPLVLLGWGLLALAGAVFLGLFEPMAVQAGPGARALRTVALGLALVGAVEVAGSASGSDDALAPLAPSASRTASVASAAPSAATGQTRADRLHFTPVASVADLDRLVAASAAAGRPVMLDFYADWCVACKEMERDSFTDAGVVQALDRYTLLRADVTANTLEQRALMKRYALFGPPGLLFFDAAGQEQASARVIGYSPPVAFRAHLASMGR